MTRQNKLVCLSIESFQLRLLTDLKMEPTREEHLTVLHSKAGSLPRLQLLESWQGQTP